MIVEDEGMNSTHYLKFARIVRMYQAYIDVLLNDTNFFIHMHFRSCKYMETGHLSQ